MARGNTSKAHRKSRTEGLKDEWTTEERIDNAYGHEALAIQANEEFKKRGVKDPNSRPTADYTFRPTKKVLDRVKKKK